MNYLSIQGREVRVSNLDKVFWPSTGTTKGQMLDYYIKISPLLLPCLRGRLISMQRFPDGAESAGFYQKNCPANAPEWVRTFALKRKGGKQTNYVLVEDMPTLVWLVNLGVIEFHPWLSSTNTLDNPDFAVFDLDPMEKYGIEEVRQVALGIGEVLSKLDLQGRVKTSGATGLQVFVPLEPRYTYVQVRDFVHASCTIINRSFPEWTTLERSIDKREGKIYLDYMQNAREQTIVSAYSLRPQSVPSFSAPLEWEDIQTRIDPTAYTLESFLAGAQLRSWLDNIQPQRLEQAVSTLKTML